jgi:hypothetical protein
MDNLGEDGEHSPSIPSPTPKAYALIGSTPHKKNVFFPNGSNSIHREIGNPQGLELIENFFF